MHADGPRAVGPHGKPVEASAGTTASDVGDIWKSVSKNLKESKIVTTCANCRITGPRNKNGDTFWTRGNSERRE